MKVYVDEAAGLSGKAFIKMLKSVKASNDSIRRFAMLISPIYVNRGYVIINRRGRNKLVDVRRMK